MLVSGGAIAEETTWLWLKEGRTDITKRRIPNKEARCTRREYSKYGIFSRQYQGIAATTVEITPLSNPAPISDTLVSALLETRLD
jgi:hypothetical protein